MPDLSPLFFPALIGVIVLFLGGVAALYGFIWLLTVGAKALIG